MMTNYVIFTALPAGGGEKIGQISQSLLLVAPTACLPAGRDFRVAKGSLSWVAMACHWHPIDIRVVILFLAHFYPFESRNSN